MPLLNPFILSEGTLALFLNDLLPSTVPAFFKQSYFQLFEIFVVVAIFQLPRLLYTSHPGRGICQNQDEIFWNFPLTEQPQVETSTPLDGVV